MNNKITNWSQLRFFVIGGLLARPPEPGKLGEEIKRLAGRCYRHPRKDEGQLRCLDHRALVLSGLEIRRSGGALERKVRADAGARPRR